MKGILKASLAILVGSATCAPSFAQVISGPYLNSASDYSDKYMRGASKALAQGTVKKTTPLALFVDEAVPANEQWTIVLDETLQSKAIEKVEAEGDWREKLQATLSANGLVSAIDDASRIVAVSSTGPNSIALLRGYRKPAGPASAPDEVAGLGPVEGGSVIAPFGAPAAPVEPSLGPLPEAAIGGLVAADMGEVPPRLMSVDEFNNEVVSVDLANVSVDTALRAALPEGWRIVLPEGAGLDTRLISANTETTRGQVLAELGRELRLQFYPFPNKGVLMARESK